MKEKMIISFDTCMTPFLLYFPCIILGLFCMNLLISWSNIKSAAPITREQMIERTLILVLLTSTCLAMFIADLRLLDVERIQIWPNAVFWTAIIVGIPGLILSTLFLLIKCIELWSDACSRGVRARYWYLSFLSCWLFCCLIQLIIFILVIKKMTINYALDSFL